VKTVEQGTYRCCCHYLRYCWSSNPRIIAHT